MTRFRKILARTLAAALVTLSLTPMPLSATAETAALDNLQRITLSGDTAATEAAGVTLESGRVTITQPGNYALSGTFLGKVAVDLAAEGEVTLLLDGASIQVDTGAAISSAGAAKTVIVLADGAENTLVSGGEDTAADETAALQSSNALIVSGAGTLTITAGKDGIVSKDALLVTGGNLNVEAEDDALDAKTDLRITGGKLTIAAGDDGVHSDGSLTITGGEINITKSEEGIEGVEMVIAGGVINVVSSDDAINAAGGEVTTTQGGPNASTSSGNLTISGGLIVVNAEGDGIDVNGNLTMTGGEVYVAGSSKRDNGALDHDGTFVLTGGTIVALDNGGMSVGPTSTEIAGGLVTLSGSSTFQIGNNAGTVLSFTPNKGYTTAVVYSDKLTKGETYTVTSESTSVTLTAETQAVGMQFGGPGRGGFPGGNSPDGNSLIGRANRGNPWQQPRSGHPQTNDPRVTPSESGTPNGEANTQPSAAQRQNRFPNGTADSNAQTGRTGKDRCPGWNHTQPGTDAQSSAPRKQDGGTERDTQQRPRRNRRTQQNQRIQPTLPAGSGTTT